MSLQLRIKWWFEEQKSKLPGWVLIGWPIFWTIYTGIPDLFDATNFWIEKAKTVSGKIGLSAAIIDSPWFNLGLFILGVLYLRYVGEVQRPLRHPAWPILGWAVVVIVALTFWSVLVAGYVATHVHQQGASAGCGRSKGSDRRPNPDESATSAEGGCLRTTGLPARID